jgi:hypothetical protein
VRAVERQSIGGIGFTEEERNLPSSLGHNVKGIRPAWGGVKWWAVDVGFGQWRPKGNMVRGGAIGQRPARVRGHFAAWASQALFKSDSQLFPWAGPV